MMNNTPKVSCLMISGGDRSLAARAIHCYQQQNWKRKELVVVDSGTDDLTPLLEDIETTELRYIRHETDKEFSRSAMLNIGLDNAGGDYILNWEEQDWHHPERIRIQAGVLMDGFSLCWLGGTLLHLDHPGFVHHPYVDSITDGYPASLMHRRNPDFRYPEKSRDPLREFTGLWEKDTGKQLDRSYSWLIVHSLSGATKSKAYKKFLSGIRNNSKDLVRLAWLSLRGRDRVTHSRFRLDPQERESFHLYLQESQRLGLIRSVS